MWENFLNQLFELVLIPLIIALGLYAVNFIRVKAAELKEKIKGDKEDKYIDRITEIISACVITTNQTYVETLKKQGNFNAEAQKEAFNQTKDAVMGMLNEELQNFIAEFFGDINAYLTNQIEATVYYNKANS